MFSNGFRQGVDYQQKQAQENEPAGRSLGEGHRLIAGGHDLNAENGAKPDTFPNGRKNRQRQRKTKPHSQTVRHGRQRRIFESKGFRPCEDDAVHHNQRNVNAQCRGHGRQKSFDQQVDDGNESGDNDHEAGNTHLFRDDIPQK